jgi:Flp pilus assembly protein TadB
MVYLVLAASAVGAVVAAAMIVLVRRERRRTDSSPEARRIEAAATRGLRDARRQAHAYQHFSGVSALRDHDSRS